MIYNTFSMSSTMGKCCRPSGARQTGWIRHLGLAPQAICCRRSAAGPDRSIRMADLRKGKAVSRRYHNRRVGEFLKELELKAEGLVERIGPDKGGHWVVKEAP